MKNLNLVYVICSALIFFNCSTDNEPIENTNAPNITNYIFKTYNVSITPDTVIDSTNYVIDNNRIISSSSLNFSTNVSRSSEYTYVSNRISQVRSYTDGVLTRIQDYAYNNGGDLIEYLNESIDAATLTSSYDRHRFTHTPDTIFSTWDRSFDGINFDFLISNFKIVLNANDNRTYLEEEDIINDKVRKFTSIYDVNNNLLEETSIIITNTDVVIPNVDFSHTFSTGINSFYVINEATYTHKNLMLLYHLQGNAINNINVKSITPNTLESFESSFAPDLFNFEINNTLDTNNNAIFSDYRTIASGSLFTRFTQEFILQ